MEFQVNLIGRKNLSGEIYRQIRNAIGDGRRRPGDCLPASRDLAQSLKVSRTTVTVAYDRLAGEGYLISRVGAGTYVNNQVLRTSREEKVRRVDGSLKPRPVWNSISLSRAFDKPAEFDFRTGLPDASLFPYDTWRRLVVRALRSKAVAGGVYGEAGGHRGLRQAIARHIGISRGVQVSADDITITSGAQQSLDLAVVQQASTHGIEIQRLAKFAVDGPLRPGLLFGYGAIPTSQIPKGLSLLRSCFESM
jgi:GntR family transcriptional regulator / MocR family aminotransferase